jgi:hypothetical protein
MLENPPLASNIDTGPVEMFEEGRRYFMGKGRLNNTLARLSRDLEDHGIDYVVIGAVALRAHGYPRFTENIDLLMTADGFEKFQQSTIDGVNTKIRISMSDLTTDSTEIDGIRYVTLEKLIELKLAAGISAPHRLKDLADVQELIKFKHLDANFAVKLDPYVRAKYIELQEAVSKSEDIGEK